jgi:SpoVK/Ycf46/Vps4 family AAA+-type ATPase
MDECYKKHCLKFEKVEIKENISSSLKRYELYKKNTLICVKRMI